MILLGPGVVAVGVGVRTTPASAERLAAHLLAAGVATTVLAVPMNQRGDGGHLDRVCTVVDTGTVIMVPALAFTLTALSITAKGEDLRVSRPRPFLEAAAEALGTERLTVIDTGLDSRCGAGAGQWDDGGNALAIGPRVAVCNERHAETNARLADAGFEIIAVPGSELGAFRGGPRGMCAAIHREPALRPVQDQASREQAIGSAVAGLDEAGLADAGLADAGLAGVGSGDREPAVAPVPAMAAADDSRRAGQLTPLG